MTRSRAKRGFLIALCSLFALLFAALGVWQVERRHWKLDLIRKVETRVHAPAVAAPPEAAWPGFDSRANAYRRVEATGIFRHDRETRVDALTDRGAGWWLMTPLVTSSGTILINRGFVPKERSRISRPAGNVTLRGLLRPSEPGGRVLRANAPEQDRWYSRDVAAIARARKLGTVAPFFIDAEAATGPGPYPMGGLTVIHFRNAHLSYALTWFALALLCVGGLVILLRDPHKPR